MPQTVERHMSSSHSVYNTLIIMGNFMSAECTLQASGGTGCAYITYVWTVGISK